MIPERLSLGVEDGSMLVRGDRADVEAVRQGSLRDVGEGRSAHAEEPADRLEPVTLE